MRFWHRGTVKPNLEEMLNRTGVSFQPSPSVEDPRKASYLVLEIDESNPAWAEVKQQINDIFFWTEFSTNEIAEAEWSMGHARHSIKTLRPGDYGWSTEFFADQCSHCGSGWRQMLVRSGAT